MSWTKHQDIFLKENVGKLTHRDIAIELKKGKSTISRRSKQLGLSGINLTKSTQFKKIYSVNENFFDKINIINSYYAGLIAADGHICGNYVSLTQSEPRLYAIKRFKKCVCYDGKIYKAKHKKGYNSFSITITSKKWQNVLKNNFGIAPKKSLNLKPPNIENFDHILAFIVGLIDGDGTVNFYKIKRHRKMALISLCGTYDITSWVFKLWQNNCDSIGSKKSKGPHKITENNTWGIGITGFKAIKFYKLIENLNIPKMESKWDVFKNEIEENGECFYLKDFRKDREKGKHGKFI